MQESMYKNSQWPECERHRHFIHNECNALFMLTCAQYLCLTVCFLNEYRSRKVFAKNAVFFTTTTYLQMVNSHWYQQTHTSNIQGSKYSILDVHSPLSKHNVGCSNGSEIPALTEVVTLEIDVCTTNS